jgi:hypothetical protein
MTLAELFVKLGIKGDASAKKSLTSVEGGLKNISTASLEAKAAMLAIFYGIEKLVSKSGQLGGSLKNFGLTRGLNPETLQRWTYASKLAGAGAGEMESSVSALQQKLVDLQMKGTPIEGLKWLEPFLEKNKRNINDVWGILGDLQELSQAFKDQPQLLKSILDSFGLSEGVQAGMFRNIFNENTFKKAPIYSKGEIDQLDRARQIWVNIGEKIDKAFGRFTAKHGQEMSRWIDNLIPKVILLTDSFIKLAEALKIFEHIGKSFEGWGRIFEMLNTDVKGISKGGFGYVKDEIKKGSKDFLSVLKYIYNSPETMSEFQKFNKSIGINTPKSFSENQQNITINQTFNNIDSPVKAGQASGRGVKEALKANRGTTSAQAILQGP